jgi:hypothetical protein
VPLTISRAGLLTVHDLAFRALAARLASFLACLADFGLCGLGEQPLKFQVVPISRVLGLVGRHCSLLIGWQDAVTGRAKRRTAVMLQSVNAGSLAMARPGL